MRFRAGWFPRGAGGVGLRGGCDGDSMKRGTRPETTEVAPEQLYNRCDPGQFRFRTTEELKDLIEYLRTL